MLRQTLALTAAVLAANVASAALVQFDFGTIGSPTLSPSVVDANLDATAMVNDGGLGTFTTAGDGYATQPVLKANPTAGVSTFTSGGVTYRSTAQVRTGFHTFSFTVTPKPGQTMRLSELSFMAAGGGTSSPPRTVSMFSSATGTTPGNATGTVLMFQNVGTAASNARPNLVPFSVDLSTRPEFQNLTGPVQFIFGVGTSAADKSIEYDNFALQGTVVPEPASLSLLALAGLTLRRRR